MTETTQTTQTPPPSPLATAEPWDLVAGEYAHEVVPIFETFAKEALRLANVAQGMRVVDVACGPGTLSFLAARAGAMVDAIDFSPRMIAELQRRAAIPGGDRVTARVGDGMVRP